MEQKVRHVQERHPSQVSYLTHLPTCHPESQEIPQIPYLDSQLGS